MNKVLLHIPHSSKYIPKYIKKDIPLSDLELEKELEVITDLYTDIIFQGKDSIKCEFSRLVCDVERFENDELETMAKLGMGAVYTKTPSGKTLRDNSETIRNYIINNYYRPYHAKFEEMVKDKLNKYNECFILDCHSFNENTNYVNMKNAPDICIGADIFHTPDKIKNRVIKVFQSFGYKVSINTPFSGSIVPLSYFNQDKRVSSMMIEVNRKLYIKDRDEINEKGMNMLTYACSQVLNLL